MTPVFEIITLLVAAAFVAISVANAILFSRVRNKIQNSASPTTSTIFGPDSKNTAFALWVVNILMAVVGGMLFMYAIYMVVKRQKMGPGSDKSAPAGAKECRKRVEVEVMSAEVDGKRIYLDPKMIRKETQVAYVACDPQQQAEYNARFMPQYAQTAYASQQYQPAYAGQQYAAQTGAAVLNTGTSSNFSQGF